MALSPTKVICWPWYFFLIAAAFGTAGGEIVAAVAAARFVGLVPAAATLSETASVVAPTSAATMSSARCCFTLVLPFFRPNRVCGPPPHGETTPFWESHSNKTNRVEDC